MIRATLDDIETVNALLQRDWPGADYSQVLAEPLHVCLIEDDSGAIFAWRGPETYEIHLFFGVRGRAAMDMFHRMLSHIRDEFEGRRFWALIPPESRNVTMFARLVGFEPRGVLSTRDGPRELFVSENG